MATCSISVVETIQELCETILDAWRIELGTAPQADIAEQVVTPRGMIPSVLVLSHVNLNLRSFPPQYQTREKASTNRHHHDLPRK
jgi:hypothetical protein